MVQTIELQQCSGVQISTRGLAIDIWVDVLEFLTRGVVSPKTLLNIDVAKVQKVVTTLIYSVHCLIFQRPRLPIRRAKHLSEISSFQLCCSDLSSRVALPVRSAALRTGHNFTLFLTTTDNKRLIVSAR